MSVQHVLTVFRTQRISRLTLHLESDANTLLLVVHADNGEPNSPASHKRQALYRAALVVQLSLPAFQSMQLLANPRTPNSTFAMSVLSDHASRRIWPAGLEKRYTVPCLEAEILQATVDKDMFPIYLLAEAAELSRCSCCRNVQTHSLPSTSHNHTHVCAW